MATPRYVTHAEFQDAFSEQSARFERSLDALRTDLRADRQEQDADIKKLVEAKQVSWPLIVSIVGVLLTVGVVGVGAGVANWTRGEMAADAVSGHSAAIEEFRERIRAQEAGLSATIAENETQNRWLADVLNLQVQRIEQLSQFQPSDYWPLGQIGRAMAAGD